ncbi:MAG: UvrD-helicase domain-containing protein [Thermosynechococcaceae cyanobacterium]
MANTIDHAIRLVLSIDFLNAFSKLPKQIQGKTQAFIQKFKQNPTSSGINYENINNAKDANLKSVRVDLTYRAIIRKPDSGNSYLLLWVDKHDEAYDWAQKKVCKINPESGALQLIDVEAAATLESELTRRQTLQAKGRFDGIHDRYLLRLGVPEELLGAMRAVITDNDVDQLIDKLPEEAADAILALASGYSINDILDQQAKSSEQAVDTEDLDQALELADSKRRFHVVTDDDELLAMLAAPLEQWRVFLHPSQRRLVQRHWNGPVRVLGGAGTGKTVVAMHRAKWLAEQVFTAPTDRILFTTYTKNLAIDIEANLREICSPETMRRIKVENLDSWVVNFFKTEGVPLNIVFDDALDELWDSAYTVEDEGYALAFYKDEWKQVIQPQNVTNLQGYIKASRIGRGTRLNRIKRAAIWPVFEEFSSLLKQKGWKEREEAMHNAHSLLQNRSESLPYRAVIVDEAQDMGMAAFKLIRAIVPPSETGDDLFIVGDPHQRIYGRKVVLGQCGIEVRGRSSKLRLNYRTTDETRRWATAVLSGMDVDDLDGGQDGLQDYRSLMHGEDPIISGFEHFQQELDYIAAYLQACSPELQANICVVVRSHHFLQTYRSSLEGKGLTVQEIKRSAADNPSTPGVRIATMHRVKGLQFEDVILAGVDSQSIPPPKLVNEAADNAAKAALLDSERSLIHVAATRAKKGVLVTYHGQPCALLPGHVDA